MLVDVLAGADLGRPVVRPSMPAGGVPLVLSTVPVPGGRVLVVSTRLRLPAGPAADVHRHVRLVTPDGTVLATAGATPDADVRTTPCSCTSR